MTFDHVSQDTAVEDRRLFVADAVLAIASAAFIIGETYITDLGDTQAVGGAFLVLFSPLSFFFFFFLPFLFSFLFSFFVLPFHGAAMPCPELRGTGECPMGLRLVPY